MAMSLVPLEREIAATRTSPSKLGFNLTLMYNAFNYPFLLFLKKKNNSELFGLGGEIAP